MTIQANSQLQKIRLQYKPNIPKALEEIEHLDVVPEKDSAKHNNKELANQFPRTFNQPIVRFAKKGDIRHKPLKIGVVLSGGPAPGGHNVITGLYDSLKKMNANSRLFGFLNGPGGIVNNQHIELEHNIISQYRNQGGFDLIGSGRTKIETPEQFLGAVETVSKLQLDGLVIVGGDDSNTNAAFLAEHFLAQNVSTRVIGVPKTIDGDLKNQYIEVSFGFDTATKTFSETIGNILRDSLSQKKYYFFIKMMGRSASHIALECALRTHPNLTLIGEEIANKKMTLQQITNQIADLICERSKKGKDYGVILIPEGVVEFIPEIKKMIGELNALPPGSIDPNQVESSKKHLSEEANKCFSSIPKAIQTQLLLDRDPHGNVKVSQIETERLIMEMVSEELKRRKALGTYSGQFSAQPHFCGYEGRSCYPSNFDSQYCYALGFVSSLLIDRGCTGYMSCISNLTQPAQNWEIAGIPLMQMMGFEERKGKLKAVIQKALVDLNSKSFSLFKRSRDQWALNDDFQFPGPIQYFGPSEITDSVPMLLL